MDSMNQPRSSRLMRIIFFKCFYLLRESPDPILCEKQLLVLKSMCIQLLIDNLSLNINHIYHCNPKIRKNHIPV